MALGNDATRKVLNLLTAPTGLRLAIDEVARQEQVVLAPLESSQIIAQQVAFDTAERSAGVNYPTMYVYCTGLANLLKEKFRTFSGKAYMALEARVSHDRLEQVSETLQLYTAAATQALDASRGDWSDGMFYTGGYKVEFGPIKRGGRNFLQTAKVTFEVEVSR